MTVAPTALTRRGYFSDIYHSLKSIGIGMGITLKYCFSRSVCIQYPDQKIDFAARYRGIHEFVAADCIACDLCAKACPVDCIYIDYVGRGKNVKLTRFAIDYSKCMFCALCTEPCPKFCIHMGKLHDMSAFSRDEMVVEFLEIDKQNLRTPVPLWMASDKLPAWARAEKERVLAGQLATTEADIAPVTAAKRK